MQSSYVMKKFKAGKPGLIDFKKAKFKFGVVQNVFMKMKKSFIKACANCLK